MELITELTRKVLNEKKATQLERFDFSDGTFIHANVIVASASNVRLIDALCDYLLEAYEAAGIPVHHVEGTPESGWILLDVMTVAVHLFLPETRLYYGVDSLWADKRVEHHET
jgi:ribosome-associated protein